MAAAVRIVLVSLGVLTGGCLCEEWYTAQAAGKVTTTEGGSPINGAEVRIRFDVGDSDPGLTCESLKNDSFDLVDVTDASGTYKTPSRGFPHSCTSDARVNGSICVTAARRPRTTTSLLRSAPTTLVKAHQDSAELSLSTCCRAAASMWTRNRDRYD